MGPLGKGVSFDNVKKTEMAISSRLETLLRSSSKTRNLFRVPLPDPKLVLGPLTVSQDPLPKPRVGSGLVSGPFLIET